jgi:hypothetical protein
MDRINQEQIEIIIGNAQKPRSLSNIEYPLNSLDDRIFEILTYSLFKKRQSKNIDDLNTRFDEVVLMQGVGEKGMDCVLIKNHLISSVIQCKKYASNLSDVLIFSELIKFGLYVLINKKLYSINNNFTYFIATTTGFTEKSILLPGKIKNGSFSSIYDLDKITH